MFVLMTYEEMNEDMKDFNSDYYDYYIVTILRMKMD